MLMMRGILILFLPFLGAIRVDALPNLIRDGAFDDFKPGNPGSWEFRYAHKGGNNPGVRPLWQCVPEVDDQRAETGRHIHIRKDGPAAGAILIGQRVLIPEHLPPLELGFHLQAYCASPRRSGIITASIRTLKQWNSLASSPKNATEPLPSGDIFHTVVKSQGDDVTDWTPARIPASALRSALEECRGSEVIINVSYLTWHETAEEWARFDNLRFGDPTPHIETASWPRYVYRREPLKLTINAYSDLPEAKCLLRYRPADRTEAWQTVTAIEGEPRVWEATIPAEAVTAPLEAQALMPRRDLGDMTMETHKMQLTERPGHPNLFYSTHELARMREKLDAFPWAKEAFSRIKSNADNRLERDFQCETISGFWWHHYNCADCGARLSMKGPREHLCPVCKKTWDTDILHGVYWSKVHGKNARAARDLALTYQMTGDETYARKAVEILLWYARHYKEFSGGDKGGRVLSQTLDECIWLLRMMEAADLVYPVMNTSEARSIEKELILAGAMFTRKYRGGIHNIRCWHNACWASAGYFLGDPDLVTLARDDKHGFVAQMEQGVLEDGMWYERSMDYHSYTVSAITYHVKAAMHNSDDLYQIPQVRKLLLFPLRIAFPNLVTPSLNDGGFNTRRLGPNRLELAAAWYDDQTAVSALNMLYATGASRANFEAWQFGESLPKGTSYATLPSMNLPGTGLAVLRQGRGPEATCALIEYGEHGGGHGHPDKLQLILYGLGQQLCPDLGTTRYANPLHSNYYKCTPAHNTVTIGGQDMAPQSGELIALNIEKDSAAAVVRTDRVYDDTVLTRRILLSENVVVDEFTVLTGGEATIDWFLRCEGDLELSVPVRDTEQRPLSPPYKYLKNIRATETDDQWTASWRLPPAEDGIPPGRLLVTFKGEPGTRAAQMEAPGPARTGRMYDTLRVRRETDHTRFIAVYQILPGERTPDPVGFDKRTINVGDLSIDLGRTDETAPALR